jgi:hypothetical protein
MLDRSVHSKVYLRLIIDHTQNLNQLVSTRHGLGVTDGEIRIGRRKQFYYF